MEDVITKYAPMFHMHSKEMFNSMCLFEYISKGCEFDNAKQCYKIKTQQLGTKGFLQLIVSVVELNIKNIGDVCDIVYGLFFPQSKPLKCVILRFIGNHESVASGIIEPRCIFINDKLYRYNDNKKLSHIKRRVNLYISKYTHNIYRKKPKTTCINMLLCKDKCDKTIVIKNPNIAIFNPRSQLFRFPLSLWYNDYFKTGIG